MFPKITAVVADYRLLYREPLCLQLEKKGISIIARQEMITQALPVEPDIMIFPVTGRSEDAIETIRAILQRYPQLKILVLARQENGDTSLDWILAGAKGCVYEHQSVEELVRAIKLIHEKGFDYTTVSAQRLLEKIREKTAKKEPLPEFSFRQKELLPLLCSGMPYKQIADQLFISVKTIEYNRRAIMEKTGCHSNEELVRYCVKQKLIEP